MSKKKDETIKTALGEKPEGERPHKEPTAKKLLAMVDDVETVSIPRKHFSLTKVKMLKDNRGVETTYQRVKQDSGVSSVETSSVISHVVPHPDLIKAIEGLSRFAVHVCGLTKYLDAPEVGQEYSERSIQAITEAYAPTGLCLNGADAKRKAMITGVWNCFGNYKISLNTPNILLESEQFEIEEELMEAVEKIENETFAYLFKNKRSQMDLFQEGDEETE